MKHPVCQRLPLDVAELKEMIIEAVLPITCIQMRCVSHITSLHRLQSRLSRTTFLHGQSSS